MVFFVSGYREENLLQRALAMLLVQTVNPDEYERLAKMLARALTCIEKQGQGKKKVATPKGND